LEGKQYFRRMIRSLAFAVFIFCAVLRSQAGTFQLVNDLDNTRVGWDSSAGQYVMSGTVAAPYVGSMTLSYDAPNALANGSYAWSSFSNLSLNINFPGKEISFNQGHLDVDPAHVFVQVIDGNFFFTNDTDANGIAVYNKWAYPDGPVWFSSAIFSGEFPGQTANGFENTTYIFAAQPVNNLTRTSDFLPFVANYNSVYSLSSYWSTQDGEPYGYAPGTSITVWSDIYGGNYGNPTDNRTAGVPEPSALSLLAVGLGLVLRRSRRTI